MSNASKGIDAAGATQGFPVAETLVPACPFRPPRRAVRVAVAFVVIAGQAAAGNENATKTLGGRVSPRRREWGVRGGGQGCRLGSYWCDVQTQRSR
jgi:hypothetical protein